MFMTAIKPRINFEDIVNSKENRKALLKLIASIVEDEDIPDLTSKPTEKSKRSIDVLDSLEFE